jgi:hypothetical protein
LLKWTLGNVRVFCANGDLPAIGASMFTGFDAEHDITIGKDCRHGVDYTA